MCMAFVRRSGGSNEMLAVGFADGSIRIYSLGGNVFYGDITPPLLDNQCLGLTWQTGSQLVMTLGADVPGPVLFLEPHPR